MIIKQNWFRKNIQLACRTRKLYVKGLHKPQFTHSLTEVVTVFILHFAESSSRPRHAPGREGLLPRTSDTPVYIRQP
jgi:hypothetical protein